jgi:Sec-independent protein translocase protein TatA
MRRFNAWPAAVAVLSGLLGYTWAQSRGIGNGVDEKPDERLPVAVVDMAKVFNGFRGLAERREEYQRHVKDAEESARNRVAEFNRLKEELKNFKEGTADHKRIIEEMQEKNKDFETFRRDQQRTLFEEEARMYLWAHQRAVDEIQKFADARGIRLVIRFSSETAEPKNPQELAARLGQPVLYQSALDVTEEIIQSLN